LSQIDHYPDGIVGVKIGVLEHVPSHDIVMLEAWEIVINDSWYSLLLDKDIDFILAFILG
jgi:hypothetical protein